jgi:cysteine desulfurase
LGLACERAAAKLATEATRLADLRDRLERGILARVSRTAVNGEPTTRVPNTTNISFDGVEAESLLIALDLDGVAVSTGSACSSGTLEPSHVLRAMGLSPHRAQNAIRFSLGAGNTAEEIDHVVGLLPAIVEKLRALTHAGTRTSA